MAAWEEYQARLRVLVREEHGARGAGEAVAIESEQEEQPQIH
jgi:hypothetical protein